MIKKYRHLYLFSIQSLALCLLLCGCGNASEPVLPAVPGEPLQMTDALPEYSPSVPSTETAQEVLPMNPETETPDTEDTGRKEVIPGEKTLENMLRTAMLPLGDVMYVWGGGWNEEDTGAGTDARTIGPSPAWSDFASRQEASYNYRETRYQIHDGLDCSGFVGWVIYNTMEKENGLPGYVFKSTETAPTYASYGWGDLLPADGVSSWKPGDIMSMSGHVWISLGTCSDGSVLLLHSSPPGVRLCGTTGPDGTSEAVSLAAEYTKQHCPEWYERYPDCEVSASYLTKSAQMRWNSSTFPDAPVIQEYSPAEVLQLLSE